MLFILAILYKVVLIFKSLVEIRIVKAIECSSISCYSIKRSGRFLKPTF